MFFEDMTLNFMTWFFIGAFSHRIGTKLMGISQLSYLVQQTTLQALMALKYAEESYVHLLDLKYESLNQEELTATEVKKLKEIDSIVLESWKKSTIVKLSNGFPGILSGISRFEDWDHALRFIKKNKR